MERCNTHQKSLKLICLNCHMILCSRCTPLHNGHSFDHIDDIKTILININNNNQSNSSQINSNQIITINSIGDNKNTNKITGIFSDIQTNVELLYSSVKSKVSLYQELTKTENDITSKFQELHDYLVVQEHKLKKPIITDKEIIEQQINNQLCELKSLNTIINQIKKQLNTKNGINTTTNINSTTTTTTTNNNNNNINTNVDNNLISSTTINQTSNLTAITQLQPLELDVDSDIDASISTDDTMSVADTTDRYHLSSIIKSMEESLSFNDFLHKNNSTLFYQPSDNTNNNNNNNNNINNSIVNKCDDSSLLHMVLQHKSIARLNNSLTSSCNEKTLFRFIINNQLINTVKNDINQSVKLSLIDRALFAQQQSMVTYLFSTDNECKISLIPIANFINGNIPFDSLKIEQVPIKSEDRWSFNSVIAIGDHIYKFGGGLRRSNRYQRFSISSRLIDIDAEMTGVGECNCISVCYDSKDYIYLLDGNIKSNTIISRYHIRTHKFEKYATINNTSYHHLSFFYRGHLYSVIPIQKRIIKFDPVNFTTVNLAIDLLQHVPNARISCFDGKGNIYIQSSTNFIRINIETAHVKMLSATKNISANNQLIYHQAGPNENNIYSLQGKDHNFVYSIETNKWNQILKDDQSDRSFCGSTIITKL
ncbi:hypothetical protein PPL_09403 [Heterostelium album PN500]|uniref:B box-type domain-containing protein n=1 Tax=Heterostelium pallidum (strain ATCC 26659 / Pp 5 / PN500) TaxID=670386 RepID=D3BLG9_HETP5|nr:hypothetical protein PPL_09403 [Heterostelium album PN500]EFA77746.1 hypothetical protein PPL_09403 [Heterostelium album PN500]|eukprot:XP_020429874.1 hypothetical protein PPL_09403 [Heterostelium album PN500]